MDWTCSVVALSLTALQKTSFWPLEFHPAALLGSNAGPVTQTSAQDVLWLPGILSLFHTDIRLISQVLPPLSATPLLPTMSHASLQCPSSHSYPLGSDPGLQPHGCRRPLAGAKPSLGFRPFCSHFTVTSPLLGFFCSGPWKPSLWPQKMLLCFIQFA